jgi:hypothetical protein
LPRSQPPPICYDRTLRKFAVDAIARCVFATKLDNLDDPNDPFMKNAEDMSRNSAQAGNSPFFAVFCTWVANIPITELL